MAQVLTGITPAFSKDVTADWGTVNTVTVTLISTTISGAEPGQVWMCVPLEAMATGLAIGASYCVAKDTVVTQVINPTAGNVAAGSKSYRFIRL